MHAGHKRKRDLFGLSKHSLGNGHVSSMMEVCTTLPIQSITGHSGFLTGIGRFAACKAREPSPTQRGNVQGKQRAGPLKTSDATLVRRRSHSLRQIAKCMHHITTVLAQLCTLSSANFSNVSKPWTTRLGKWMTLEI